jgi:adenylate cyclase
MNQSKRYLKEPPVIAGVVVLVVFSITALIWQWGGFQKFELLVYDQLIRETRRPLNAPTQVVLVPIEEADISNPQWGGYPLRDSVCAQILERITACEPAAVGVDIYRDIPVPFDGAERAVLDKTLTEHPEIVCIFLMGQSSRKSVPPPSALKDVPQQIGFNDFPRDDQADQIVRRGLMFMEIGGETFTSLSLQLAQTYLESKEIYLEPVGDDSQDLKLGAMTLSPLRGSEGGYVDADVGGYQVFIDFRNDIDFPRVTLTELLADGFDASRLKGKLVLLGTWAPSIKDTLQTPLSADFPGPQLQAVVADQLLRGALGEPGASTLRTWSETTEALWLLLACCLGVLAGLFSRTSVQLAASGTITGLLIGTVVYAAFGTGLWIPGVMPLVGGYAAMAVIVAYRSAYEKKQNNILMHIFSQHVSGKIAEQIWEQRETFLKGNLPRPQKLTATVLFCDLRGFTTISESLDPEELIDWLNEYMEIMSHIIISNDGVIGKYIGDAIMAMFGVPVPRTSRDEMSQDAVAAVRCAMEMEKGLEELHKKWGPKGLPCAKMRVGIYTGDMVAGSVGGSQRLEYTVIGDTVNVASRLESFDRDFAHPRLGDRVSRTIIGLQTRELLDDSFETIQIGDMALKGKSEPLPLFLLCRKDYPPANDITDTSESETSS